MRKPNSTYYNPIYIEHEKSLNRIWKDLTKLSNSELKEHEVSRRHFSLLTEKQLNTSILAFHLRRKRSGISGHRGQKFHRIMPSKFDNKVGFILDKNTWKIEHSLDRQMRCAYGKSRSLEWFIKNKDTKSHGRLLHDVIPGLRRIFGKLVCVEGRLVAPFKEDLRHGNSFDAVFLSKNNRRTFVEMHSRRILTQSLIERDYSNKVSDKVVHVALAWSEPAEFLIKERKNTYLYTLVAKQGKAGLSKVRL